MVVTLQYPYPYGKRIVGGQMTTPFPGLSRELFPQLGERDVYADWTGSALAPKDLVMAHARYLTETLLGNPHSDHTPSQVATMEMEQTRAAILEFVNADPSEYEVIFTANASAAIGIMQHFRFEGGELLMTADNHNSVNGLREVARRKGAVVRYAPITPKLAFDDAQLHWMLDHPSSSRGSKLFAFPGKSNHSGIAHSLTWVVHAQKRGWRVLLDAAALMANDDLDLSLVKPDFVALSFYKMFGYPTGTGCLLVRKDGYWDLNKQWFAGGTVQFVSVVDDFVVHAIGHSAFQDGTPNFGMMRAVRNGLEFLGKAPGRKEYCVGLANALRARFLRHASGPNRIIIHNPADTDMATFSVMNKGLYLLPGDVARAARAESIYFRSGCFCNPGVSEAISGHDSRLFREFLAQREDHLGPVSHDEIEALFDGTPASTIRVSFGYANSHDDVNRIGDFFDEYLSA